ERLRAHSAFADDRADTVSPDDLALIRLFADARRRSRGVDLPTVTVFHGHGTAVIQDRAAQVDRWLVRHQMRVYVVASAEHPSRDEDDVADFQRAYVGIRERRLQRELASGSH